MHDEGVDGRRTVHGGAAWPDRLDSWKQIAAYLGRGVTTLQRWEQEEGLPIHRLPHAKKGSVFAFRHELDAWLAQRAQARPKSPGDGAGRHGAAAPASRWRFVAIATGLLLAVIGLIAMLYDASGAMRSSETAAGQTPTAADQARNLDDAEGAVVSEPAVVPGLSPRIVAADPTGELSPSLSPDGTRVVYGWERAGGGFGLYIKPVAGGIPRKLAIGPGLRFEESPYPTWSPRGDLIAFLAYEAPQIYGLYIVSPNGAAARRLTSMAGIGLCWHPDGQSIGVVDRHSTGEPFSVFAVSLETGQRRRLTTPAAGVFGDTHCAFSHDGRRLAVVRYGTRQVSDLFVIDDVSGDGAGSEASGHHARTARSDARPPAATSLVSRPDESTRTRRLTHDLPGLDGITWTPDDSAVIAGSQRGLWRIGVSDVSTPTLIAAADGGASSPSFARGGDEGHTRLVYAYARRNVDIWWWHARIGNEEHRQETSPLLAGSPEWDDEPALSPDGQQVVFTSNRSGRPEIWIASARGASARQLTSHGPVVMSPQWSPDGRRIAFVRQVGGDRDVYVIDADGARSTRLTWEPTQEENPTWSRDGDSIYFRSDRGGIGQIWKARARGGEPARRVTTGAGSQAFESPDRRTLYFVRGTDAPGLWSMPVAGGAETLLLPEVRERLWGVADDGIAFVDRSDLRATEGLPIRFYDLATGKTTTRAMIAMSPEVTIGFAIARDGRCALWTTVAPIQHDLMLVDVPSRHSPVATRSRSPR
jgi:Tol biopolymer transport system component